MYLVQISQRLVVRLQIRIVFPQTLEEFVVISTRLDREREFIDIAPVVECLEFAALLRCDGNGE